MPESVYEVLSMGMRYFFTLLGVLLVWRAITWQLAERRARHRRLKRLPDAGTIGEMVVTRGCPLLPEGTVLPMPYEGTLGSSHGCDLLIPARGAARQHLDFSFQNKRGVLLYLRRGQSCQMDGKTLTAHSKPRRWPMVHGSTLTIGDCELRLRLFAGLETVKRRPSVRKAAPKPSVDETVRYVAPYEPPQDTQPSKPLPRAPKADPAETAKLHTHPLLPVEQDATAAHTGVKRRSPSVPLAVNQAEDQPAAPARKRRRRSHADQA